MSLRECVLGSIFSGVDSRGADEGPGDNTGLDIKAAFLSFWEGFRTISHRGSATGGTHGTVDDLVTVTGVTSDESEVALWAEEGVGG